LLKGFDGDKAALLKRLALPDMIGAYNVQRKRDPRSYPEKTLGWLVAWFKDSERCPEYAALSDATRADYSKALAYLEPEFDCPLDLIAPGDLYTMRDRAAADKWPAFADTVITALSSMFGQAIKRSLMGSNPAKGIQRAHKRNQNANREWRPEEWTVVIERAPGYLKTAYMLARHLGYRSQSIVAVMWTHYQPDADYGMCFRVRHKKNDEVHWLPAAPELQEYLAGLKVRTKDGHIALRSNGKPWESAEQLQKLSSAFLTGLARDGQVGAGLTEHGLRATFAAARKRERRASDSEVAAALGDRDTRMGAHYTRHIENEFKVAQAFGKPNKNRTGFGKPEGASFPKDRKKK
jgi:integrase